MSQHEYAMLFMTILLTYVIIGMVLIIWYVLAYINAVVSPIMHKMCVQWRTRERAQHNAMVTMVRIQEGHHVR